MTEHEFESVSTRHKNKVVGYFIVFLSVSSLSFLITEWASSQRGWEADFISGLFYLVMAITGLAAFMFGFMVYAWFKNYKYAKRDSATNSLDQLQAHWSEVVGPIQWR